MKYKKFEKKLTEDKKHDKKIITRKMCMFCMPVGLPFKSTGVNDTCVICNKKGLVYEVEFEVTGGGQIIFTYNPTNELVYEVEFKVTGGE